MLPKGPVKTAISYRAAGKGRHRMSLFLASQCHEVFGVTQRNSGISVRCSAELWLVLPFFCLHSSTLVTMTTTTTMMLVDPTNIILWVETC